MYIVTNRNGEKLLDFMEEYNLCPVNTKFVKCKNQLWTFEYPNGDRAQIDYILVRKKWQNSVVTLDHTLPFLALVLTIASCQQVSS